RTVERAMEMALLAIQRHRDEEALREQEETLRAMTNATHYSVLMLDQTCEKVLFANRRLFDQIRAGHIQWADAQRVNLEMVVTYMRSLATDQRSFQRFFDGFRSGRLDHRSGEEALNDGTTIRWSIAPVTHANGNLIGRSMVVEDITALRELENKLRQASKLEALGTLAGGIAHDFNNILTPILGLATLGASDEPEGSESRRRWQTVLDSSRRARDLIRKILSFSRRAEVRSQTIDMRKLLKSSVELLREALPSTIAIECDFGECEALVEGDPASIEQVVLNIATNAFHSMEDQGGVLALKVREVGHDEVATGTDRLSRGRRYLEIEIRDTGAGIPPEDIERIFDPFFTTKPVGKGTGLGLSQALGIVQAHEGLLHVESSRDHTSFFISLPLSSETEHASTPQEPISALTYGSGRILVVEDEPAVREVQVECLTSVGYDVVARDNGRAALELLIDRRESFDLVLTDQTMPEIRGTDVVRRMREAGITTPVVLCTGVLSNSVVLEADILGVDACLPKPILLGVLTKTVADLIQQAKASPAPKDAP
ncbi:MAG: response regulator, partial [Planctomycetes bacterium]|nr:response regulator [Planctomycetota bacterium]